MEAARTLAPQRVTDALCDPVEDQLKAIFWKILFEPLTKAIAEHTDHPVKLLNDKGDALRDAIRTGRVQYHDGIFSGDLSAAISSDLRRLGATFDRRRGQYRMPSGDVPPWVRAEAAGYGSRAKAAHDALLDALDDIRHNLAHAVDVYKVDPSETLGRIEKGFQRVASQVKVMPSLSTHSKEELSKEYSNNMKLWIEKWTNETVTKLRTQVEDNALQGHRFSSLAKVIKSQYGVSQSKAKFLARQETSLFMSNYRKEKFTEAGIQKYRWSSSHDVRVRHDHRELDGTVWSYDNPPVVDKFTQRKGNPGTDYNCRCVDIPLVGSHLMEA